jgi:hypothetical protein
VKRFILVPLLLAGALCAQQASVTSTTAVDINGHRVSDGPQVVRTKSPTGSVTTETLQSVNGRMVPLERVEERTVRDDASGRVVERLIRRYDPQGNPTQPVKETIDEQKRPDGSSTTQTTTYRGDVNGNMQLLEKSVTELRKSGSSESTETSIQRPTVNGSVETVEKRSSVKTNQPGGAYQEETNTQRKSPNGGFYTAVRQTTEHTQQGSQASDNTAEYEVGANGQLQLHGQTVSKTVTRPDGSKDVVVDIFGQSVPGTVDSGTGGLKLQEQQVIQRTPGPGGMVTETVSVRRPSVSDPNKLGPERQLSQTVCKGDCNPQPGKGAPAP